MKGCAAMKIFDFLHLVPANTKVRILDENLNIYTFPSPDDVPLFLFRKQMAGFHADSENEITISVLFKISN